MQRGLRDVRSRGVGAMSAYGGRGVNSAQAVGTTQLWERPLHASGSQSAKLWESPSAATFKHSAANKVRVSDCFTPERVRCGPRRATSTELSGVTAGAQVGLSFALDGTLRSGEHDMKVGEFS
jgi:hypothetical protein